MGFVNVSSQCNVSLSNLPMICQYILNLLRVPWAPKKRNTHSKCPIRQLPFLAYANQFGLNFLDLYAIPSTIFILLNSTINFVSSCIFHFVLYCSHLSKINELYFLEI